MEIKKLSIVILLLILPALSHADCISIKQAQTVLKQLNYFPDAVDGVMGTATGKAIKTFQMDNDLPLTGSLNQPTCKKLLDEKNKLNQPERKPTIDRIVLQAQNRLKELGYYEGPANGLKGSDTRLAVLGFQNSNALNPTGILDNGTLKKLFSEDAKPASSALDKPVVLEKKEIRKEKAAEPETKTSEKKQSARQNTNNHCVSLVVDYTPMKFASEEMAYTLAGVKYAYFIPEIGFLSCEVLTGNSSDTFYYGSTTVRQVDGGNINKLRAGYSYPFFGGSGGFDILAGGGIEYLDMSLDVTAGDSPGINRTCVYADAGPAYIGKRFMTDLKFRYVLGDDDPDYTYGISFSAGMRF